MAASQGPLSPTATTVTDPLHTTNSSSNSSYTPSAARQIDHIKELVSLSYAGSDETVAHRVFRTAAAPTPKISHRQIVRALESLKRSVTRPAFTRTHSGASKVSKGEVGDDIDAFGMAPEGEEEEDLAKEMENLRRLKEEALELAEDRVDRLEAEKTQLEGEVEDARAIAEKAQEECKQLKGRVEGLEGEVQKWKTEAEDAKGALEKQTVEHGQKFDAVQRELVGVQRSFEDARRSHQERQTSLEKDLDLHKQKLQDSDAYSQSIIENMNQQMSANTAKIQELSQLIESKEQHIHDLEASHKAELNALNKQRDEMRVNLEEQLETATTDLKIAKHKHDSLSSEHQNTLTRLTVIEKKSRRLEDELQATKTLHAQLISELEEKRDKVLSELRSSSESRIAETEQALQDMAGKLRAAEDKITSMTSEHETAYSQLKTSHDETTKTLEETDSRLKEAEKTFAETRSKMEQDHASALDELQNTLEALKNEHQNEKAKMENDHASALTELRNTLEASRNDYQNEKSKMEQDHANALSELQNKLEALKNEHQNEVQGLKEVHAQELERAQKDIEAANQAHESEKTNMKADYEAKIGEIQEKLDRIQANFRAAQKSHYEELQSVKDEHAKTLDQARQDAEAANEAHSNELHKLRWAHETSMAELHRKVEGAQNLLNFARTGHMEELQRVKDEHDRVIEESRKNAETSSVTHAKEVQNLKAEHEQVKTDLLKKLEVTQLLLNYSRASHIEELQKLKDAHTTSSLSDQNLRSQIQAKHSEELEKIKEEHATRLRDLEYGRSSIATDQAEEKPSVQKELEAELGAARIPAVKADVDHPEAEAPRKVIVSVRDRLRDDLSKQVADVRSELRLAAESYDEDFASGKADLESKLDQIDRDLQKSSTREVASKADADDVSRHGDGKQTTFVADYAQIKKDLEAVRKELRDRTHVEGKDSQVKKANVGSRRPRSFAKRPPSSSSRFYQKNFAAKESFDDYLRRASSELSELGTTISDNEMIFASRIQEHITDLQGTKDQLALDYQAKVKGLEEEKRKLEHDLAEKQQRDLDEARAELAANYDKDGKPSDSSGNPEKGSKPFDVAEAELIKEHQKDMVRRKAQLETQVAEDFKSLTAQYQANVANLLGKRTQLEGDLSVDPDKFEELSKSFEETSIKYDACLSAIQENGPFEVIKTPDSKESPGISNGYVHVDSPMGTRVRPGSGSQMNTSKPSGGEPSGIRRGSLMRGQAPIHDFIYGGNEWRLNPKRSWAILQDRSQTGIMPSPTDLRASDGSRRVVQKPPTSSKWASASAAKENAELDFGIDPVIYEDEASAPKPMRVRSTRLESQRAEPKTPQSLRHATGRVEQVRG